MDEKEESKVPANRHGDNTPTKTILEHKVKFYVLAKKASQKIARRALRKPMGKRNLDQKNKSKPITQEKTSGHSTKQRQGDPAEEPRKRTFNVMADVLTT